MKIVIAGTGGVGGYYGIKLAQDRHDVYFIARSNHLSILKNRGLTLKSLGEEINFNVNCGQDSSEFGVADMVIVCFKSYDTSTTFDLYRESINDKTVILSLQNGVENEELLSAEFGVDNVMGGIAFIGSRVEAPGVILHTAYGHIAIGELSKHTSERAEEIGNVFRECGINCKVSKNIKKDLWSKMIWNIGFNALCAILDCSARDTLLFADTKALVKGAMLEWVEVANAHGLDLDPSIADRNIESTLAGGEIIPSLLHDRRRGRKLEIETFNAKVVSLGEEKGVVTPINKTLCSIVRFYNHTQEQVGPERLTS